MALGQSRQEENQDLKSKDEMRKGFFERETRVIILIPAVRILVVQGKESKTIKNKSQLPPAVCFVVAECRSEGNLMSLYVLAASYFSYPKMITYPKYPAEISPISIG